MTLASRSLRLPLACGAVPLLLATAIYVAWRFTFSPWLVNAGMLLIIGGSLSVLTGAGLLVVFVWRLFRAHHPVPISAITPVVLIAWLLSLNFIAAAFFTASAINIATRYTLRVRNETNTSIQSFVVSGPGVRAELGPVFPRHTSRRNFRFTGKGRLIFAATSGAVTIQGEIQGYVTRDWGGDTIIRIMPEGKYEVQKNRG